MSTTTTLNYGEECTKVNPIFVTNHVPRRRYNPAIQKCTVQVTSPTTASFKDAVYNLYSSPPDNPYDDDGMVIHSVTGVYMGQNEDTGALVARCRIYWIDYDLADIGNNGIGIPSPCVWVGVPQIVAFDIPRYRITSPQTYKYDDGQLAAYDGNGDPEMIRVQQRVRNFKLREIVTSGTVDLSSNEGIVGESGTYYGLSDATKIMYHGVGTSASPISASSFYQRKWHNFTYRDWFGYIPLDSNGDALSPYATIDAARDINGVLRLDITQPATGTLPTIDLG